jgi:uncharacterized protein (UPF0276 family)
VDLYESDGGLIIVNVSQKKKPFISLTHLPQLHSFMLQLVEDNVIDCFEIAPDRYLKTNDYIYLSRIINELKTPYSFHFTQMSLGSPDFNDFYSLDKLKAFIKDFEPILISDHVSMPRIGNLDVVANMSCVHNEEFLYVFIENLNIVKNIIGADRKFLLEHIPSFFEYNSATMSPWIFYKRLLSEGNAGSLLDLHNLYVDEINYNINPFERIDQLSSEQVLEIHVAGGSYSKDGSVYFDGHNNNIPERVFELLEYCLPRFSPLIINLERENDLKNFKQIKNDLLRLRQICDQVKK